MSSSPFEIFRRNLKPLMVLLTGLAMFAFVVLPVLDGYMRRNVGGGTDEVVAEFDNVTLTRGRVDYFTRNHNSTVQFLRELAERTISRNGYPKTAGFQYDAQNRQIQSLGINENPSAMGSIRTFQFASLAGEAGFVLDDVAIQSWLQQFTDGMFSDSEINGMLMESTRNQMGQFHLYEQLRYQLLADIYLRGAFSTLSDGRMPLLTPAEQWTAFLKLNQKATVDAYGLLVSDFLDQTNKTPSESEIAEVYEEGKDRDPNEQSPEPAFHRRYAAKFEYLVGDFQSILDTEVAKLSEEQLRAEYERRLKGGAFQLPEDAAIDLNNEEMDLDPAAETQPKPETTDPETTDPETTEPETTEPETTEPETTEPETTEPETTEQETTEQESTEPETTEPEAAADTETVIEKDSDAASESSPAEPAQTTDDPSGEPDAEDQSQSGQDSPAVRLVNFQEQEAEQEESTDDPQEDSADQTPAEDQSAEEETSPEEPAEQEKSENPADDKTAEATDEKTTDAEPSEEKTAEEKAAEMKTAEAESAVQETAEEDSADAGANGETEPKVETFEDVRQQIAEDLAGPEARRKMDAAVTEITSKMRRYFNERAIHESNLLIGKAGPAPVRPDLKKLGESVGFGHEPSIGPYDIVTISDEPIAQSFEVGSELMRRGPGFPLMMFGFDNGRNAIQPQPLFSPLRTADDQTGKIYISWKIQETEAYTPPLEEVRDEVIMAIRMREARKLALAAGEELAQKVAAAGDKPLAELIPEGKKDNVKEGVGPFSWLDSFGFQGATIGNVPELDSVGNEFMEAVFDTKIGESGVAFNQPERVVYVVRPTRFEPSLDELRRQFKQPTNRMMALFVSGGDADEIIRGFYDTIDEETDFVSLVQE